MKIQITKLSEAQAPTHANNIAEGFTKEGSIDRLPQVGECFWVGSFRTSTVQELLTIDTFRTHNSIYQIKNID